MIRRLYSFRSDRLTLFSLTLFTFEIEALKLDNQSFQETLLL